MEKEKLYDALDGLYAYDTGCVSSGIHDELLRQEVIDYLHSLEEKELNQKLSLFIRAKFLTDEKIGQGYGIESVSQFISWLSDYMDLHL